MAENQAAEEAGGALNGFQTSRLTDERTNSIGLQVRFKEEFRGVI